MSVITYQEAWRTIAARVRGLERAATVHASFLAVHNKSPYGADKALQRQCELVRNDVEEFQKSFARFLPENAGLAISHFLDDAGKQISGNSACDAQLVRTILVKMVAFESELTYSLNSPIERIRSASELAFVHLQQLIVVDAEYRKKWQSAYEQGEIQCEKLGSVHLLWHGISAFKVDVGTRGKTDLVYQEPMISGVEPVALGLVLTEWKKAGDNLASAYATAKQQAALYSDTVLTGLELTGCRFLVVVTDKQVKPPEDILDGGVIYRHINIAVSPETPSIVAKSWGRSK